MRLRAGTFANAGLLLGLSHAVMAQAQLAPQPSLAVGCNWFLSFGPDGQGGANTAFPDTDAYYWLALVSESVPAGSRLRIQGRYESSRYLSFTIQDGKLQEFDAIADYLISPNAGSANPFTGPAGVDPHIPFGGSYTAYVVFGSAIPATRAPNTIYRPAPDVLAGNDTARSVLTYRTYLKNGPVDSIDALPTLVLETPDGNSVALANTPDQEACATLEPQYLRQGAAVPGSANLVDPTLPVLKPTFKKYGGAVDGLLPTSAGTVGYNPQNGFLYAKTSSLLGDLLLVRGRAPLYATESAAPEAQVRYWSICENEFNSQEVVACVADRDSNLDSAGHYDIVISPTTQAPPMADAAHGFNWLTWGSQTVGDPILRYLLQDPGFTTGIDQVQPLTDPATVMGDYAPQLTYCSSAVFAANAASGPANTFAACAASAVFISAPATGSSGGGSTSSGGGGASALVPDELSILCLLAGLRRLGRRVSNPRPRPARPST